MQSEVRFIASTIRAGKIVLGVCLGAQLIGVALGAKAEKSPEKEIGVFPISLTSAGKKDLLLADFPATFPVTHWHNDMTGIPNNTVILAESPGCPRQIVRFQDRVVGLQCHFEMDLKCIEGMIQNCEGDLKPGKYIQPPQTPRDQNYSTINEQMEIILDRLIAL